MSDWTPYWRARAERAEQSIARIEALADDWEAPLGDWQWFAAQIRAALRGDA